MMPTVHYDLKKADEATQAYSSIEDVCENLVHRSALAENEVKAEVANWKEALKKENAKQKDQMLANGKQIEGVLAAMGGLPGAAKEAVGIAARLWKAHGELTKKPSDKTAIDTFLACVKEASVNSGKLRTSAAAIQQKFPKMYKGNGPNMKAYVTQLKFLLDHIETGLPKFAPARPVQGPPAPPRPAQGPPVPGKS